MSKMKLLFCHVATTMVWGNITKAKTYRCTKCSGIHG